MTAAVALALAILVAPDHPHRRAGIAKRLVHSGIRWRVGLTCAVGVGAAALLFLLPPPVVAAGIAVSATLMIRQRRTRRARLQAREAAALQGALSVLVGELRAGVHPVAAFDAAAAEVSGPVAIGLREVAARARLGADVAAGLSAVARGSSLPSHWERLAVCWQLAHDHGLAVAALMRTAERDVIARERFSSRVRSGMAGARASAGVLAGLPLLGIGLGQLIGAHPLRFLMGAGGIVLLIGVSLSCLGLLWSDRITAEVSR
jgi:tight adherence protein B